MGTINNATGNTEMAQVIATYAGEEGMAAKVIARDDGRFAVILEDTDANEVVSTIRIFNEASPAKAYAATV